MRHLLKHVLIFSVYKGDRTETVNYNNTLVVLDLMSKLDVKVKTLTGSYQNEKESSLLVDASDRNIVESLCTEYSQDCYLERYPDGSTYLIYPDKESEYIGQWTEIGKSAALESGNYTYDSQNDAYYIAK